MSDFPPTAEQAAIVEAFRTGDRLVIEAGAGAGKTSTLRMLAAAAPRKRGLYLAYNRAIKEDAAKSFPGSVDCKTAHGLAYGPVASRYRHRLGGRRVPAQQAVSILGIRKPLRLADDLAPLAPVQLARLATATVARYCHSADPELERWHVPRVNGLEQVQRDLSAAVLPYAQRVWVDLVDPDGRLHFTHDVYLKLYQLSCPRLRYDYLLVDEAQDLNPVVQAIVEDQPDAQVVYVGDRCQAIYGWRGAVDAMSTATGRRLFLTQSFRFGETVAHEANKWLSLLDAELRITGAGPASTVGPVDEADAILCRTNATAMARIVAAVAAGQRAALVGGGGDVRSLALAALDLQARRGTSHPELMAFESWHQVCEYVDHDQGGSDLRVLVDLVEKHGAHRLIQVVDQLVDEQHADVVVSTAHKAKGREWPAVRIAGDFREPKADPETGEGGQLDPAEAMLAYVAVTRAREQLDPAGLEWVDRWLSPGWDYRPDPQRIQAVASQHVQPLCPGCETHGQLLPDGLCAACTAAEPVADPARDPVPAPIDPAALGYCWRCGTAACGCDPATAAAYGRRLLVPTGTPQVRAAWLAGHVHLGGGRFQPRAVAVAGAV